MCSGDLWNCGHLGLHFIHAKLGKKECPNGRDGLRLFMDGDLSRSKHVAILILH